MVLTTEPRDIVWMNKGRGCEHPGTGVVTISPGLHLPLLTEGRGAPGLRVPVQRGAAREDSVDVLNITFLAGHTPIKRLGRQTQILILPQ